MKVLVALYLVAAASATSLQRIGRSFGNLQYNTPSVYTYRQPVSYVPSSLQYGASQEFSPQFISSPQYIQSPSQYIQSSPQYDPDCLPNSSQYGSSLNYAPTLQQYISASPNFVSSSPQYVSASPNFVSSSPQFIARSPKVVSTPQYIARPQYYSAPSASLNNQWSSASSSATGSSATASASAYSVEIPYAYNSNSYGLSQHASKIYSVTNPVGRWDPITNTWC